jgi:hypothetical protein
MAVLLGGGEGKQSLLYHVVDWLDGRQRALPRTCFTRVFWDLHPN